MKRKLYQISCCALVAIASCVLLSCSSSRHVPQGSYLLDKVRIDVADSSALLSGKEFMPYVRQQPNHKMLWSAKLQLGIYNMSGRDSTKWYNKWLRRIGEAPVVYDSLLVSQSVDQIRRALVNKGYLHAEVESDTVVNPKKRKIEVDYHLRPGKPYFVRDITYEIENDTLRDLIMSDSMRFTIRKGDLLDRGKLDTQREIIATHLRNRGYYAFAKEFITFNADTTSGRLAVDLTMKVNPLPAVSSSGIRTFSSKPYFVRNVNCIMRYDPATMDNVTEISAPDTVDYKGIRILSDGSLYLRPSVVYENCFIRPGQQYSQRDLNRTYQAFQRLGILKFINVVMNPVGSVGDVELLDAYVLLTPGKSQSVTFEIEGTNSEGDLGVAASVAYSHRNVGKGSETLSVKLRGAYESISGNLDGLIHNRYMEYTLESSVNFPKFKAPFLRENFKRRIMASTELSLALSYQERPEYTRIIANAGWAYKWTERITGNRHTFIPIDINYVYLPESASGFLDHIAPDNPLLRYSYEDHFIMRMGYNFYHTNKRREMPWIRSTQKNIYTVRVNSEIAGNLLFAINSIFNHRSNFHNDPYRIFGIRYSQYFKVDADYGALHIFDRRNSLAWHVGFGIGVPYGNSSILPFEKRFYGGGANGVRGWSVRTLGPGSYNGSNSVDNFMNQCGDIRFDASVEYRAKLFWVVELGLFIDAGNIWTIHSYQNQPGGMFHFSTFYKQIALAYGAGIRLDFKYFLLRLDLGMKAHNPAADSYEWPLIRPDWKRDSSFHISIGYPF